MAICLIICLFYDLARVLMHDVACEFACAVRMCRNNLSANILKDINAHSVGILLIVWIVWISLK